MFVIPDCIRYNTEHHLELQQPNKLLLLYYGVRSLIKANLVR